MKIGILIITAIVTYLICGINPAILFSNAIYHRDIRNEGSGNPGFTNFRRVFGDKFAWFVFILDISKAIVLEFLFSALISYYFGAEFRNFGVAYTALFCALGHAYPVWYKFKGGKAFLVVISTVFILDWRVGLITATIFLTLLFTIRIMSVASLLSLICSVVVMALFNMQWQPLILYTICVLFVIYRHKANIVRLIHKEEKRIKILH